MDTATFIHEVHNAGYALDEIGWRLEEPDERLAYVYRIVLHRGSGFTSMPEKKSIQHVIVQDRFHMFASGLAALENQVQHQLLAELKGEASQ